MLPRVHGAKAPVWHFRHDSRATIRICLVLVKARDLALVEGILRKFLREADENGLALLGATVAQLADGEHEAGERSEIVSLFRGELEKADAFAFAGACACHAEDPADGRGLQ